MDNARVGEGVGEGGGGWGKVGVGGEIGGGEGRGCFENGLLMRLTADH